MYTSEYPFDYNTATVIPFYIETSGHPTVETITILGIHRNQEPFKGMLSLPGGFKGLETMEETAKRELMEEIQGIPEELVKPRLVTVQSQPARDPRTN